jgi:hypothetical protein
VIFWLVILLCLAGCLWGAVHHYRIERDVARALKELDDEV